MQQDLLRALVQINAAIESGQWWAYPHLEIPEAAWETHRERLAAAMTDEECWKLIRAYTEIHDLNMLSSARFEAQVPRDVRPGESEIFKRAGPKVTEAIGVITPYAKDR